MKTLFKTLRASALATTSLCALSVGVLGTVSASAVVAEAKTHGGMRDLGRDEVHDQVHRAADLLPDGTSLRALVDYALANNPRINAVKQQHLGALQQIPQAAALPDPKFVYRYFFEEVETRVGPQEYAVGISQALPWLGKLKLQRVAASDAARAAAQRIATVRNSVIAEVASAWYELHYLEQSTAIVGGSRDLVVHLERVARARYATGATTHADVIRAQVELGTIENRLASLADQRGPLLARLNSALHLPLNRPLKSDLGVASGEVRALPAALKIQPLALTQEQVLQRVAQNNPNLRVAEFEISAAESMKARAKQERLPDFNLGLDYIATGAARTPGIEGSSSNALSATIGITLPVWRSRYQAGVKEAEADIQHKRYTRDQQLSALRADTITTLFKLRDAQRQVDLYSDTLLPKAHESLAATQRAYSTGAAPFADMIDAQRVLLAFELAYTRAATDHNQARTELEKLTGATLQVNLEKGSNDEQ